MLNFFTQLAVILQTFKASFTVLSSTACFVLKLFITEFPKRPIDVLKRHIAEEADARLAYYLPLLVDPNAPPDFQPPPRPEVPPGTVDTPLIRLFNFLRTPVFLCSNRVLFLECSLQK